MAEASRLPRRPGPGVFAVADGNRHAMYHSGKDTLHKVSRNAEDIYIRKASNSAACTKPFLRYHDPKNWPLLREALKDMGRSDLIGNGKHHLIRASSPRHGQSAEKVQRFGTSIPARKQASAEQANLVSFKKKAINKQR